MSDRMINALVLARSDSAVREKLAAEFGGEYRFTFIERGEMPSEELLGSAEVIIGEPTAAMMPHLTALKWVQITWAGAEKFAALPPEVTLTNASGAFGTIISEYVLGAVISVYRSFPQYCIKQCSHIWRREDRAETVSGKRALILGAGDIGRNTALRLKAFGAYTVGIKRDPTVKSPEFDELHGMDALDRLLPQADIVICCLPGTVQTQGLMNYERLNSMKENSLLVNVGRGSLIRNDELVRALSGGRPGFAVLDVAENEPLPQDSPLWDMENVIITPHISGPSFGGNADIKAYIWELCFDNLRRYSSGEGLRNTVDRAAGY